MVLLLERLGHSLKLFSKMENHHHHHHHHHHHLSSEALSASLQTFRSMLSIGLNQLLLNSEPRSESLSLLWIQQCLGLLPMINKAFAKLVVDIDYPISKWEDASVEGYLKYSLNLLEFLNSISSSLSYLGQARLALSHALNLVENSPSLATERLKAIQPSGFSKDCGEENKEEGREESSCSGKDWVIHQALTEMKNIGYWVCGVVLSSLCADGKPCLEMEKLAAGGFVNSSFIGVDSSICKELMEKGGVLKEVKDVNDAVASLEASIVTGQSSEAAEELQRRLEVFEKLLDGLGKEVDHLFAEVLAWRNKLLDSLRLQKE